jgi:hypothetical protein
MPFMPQEQWQSLPRQADLDDANRLADEARKIVKYLNDHQDLDFVAGDSASSGAIRSIEGLESKLDAANRRVEGLEGELSEAKERIQTLTRFSCAAGELLDAMCRAGMVDLPESSDMGDALREATKQIPQPSERKQPEADPRCEGCGITCESEHDPSAWEVAMGPARHPDGVHWVCWEPGEGNKAPPAGPLAAEMVKTYNLLCKAREQFKANNGPGTARAVLDCLADLNDRVEALEDKP